MAEITSAKSEQGREQVLDLAERLCRLGDTVELRTWQHVGHFDLVEAASTDVAAWIGERLAGRPARSTCRR